MRAFECKQCGACCFGEGGITLDSLEWTTVAIFLGLTPESFLSTHTYSRNGRVYLATGEDGFCIFYDQERQCLIHPVKPKICALWPFYRALLEDRENWEAAKEACPGINPECSFEEFVRQSHQ